MSYSLPATTGVDPSFSYGGGVDFGGSSGGSSGGFGSDFLGGLESGLTEGLSGLFGGSGPNGASSSRTPYTDRTKDMLNMLISEAIQAFEPARSTIN